MGTSTSERCFARSFDGLPAGCNGNPRNASPRTPANGAIAGAWEVMRPPNDLPPATRVSPEQRGMRDGGWISLLAFVFHILELIAQRGDAASAKAGRNLLHKLMGHPGA